ncbi:hypothetical protein MtrunA17_Chr4g0045671 [Medicago truncatula]|uniref:Uncharacterized protein n=1 Tax=Medicago truncatula TaxID=3880 RepID=A0A396IBY2_MEDTR|nr:hypothetical protein MtrunA17_Chr4g0045671 [Medicago truncatula]
MFISFIELITSLDISVKMVRFFTYKFNISIILAMIRSTNSELKSMA